jgi:uncharacterized protein (DUF1015 family)
MAIIRPFRAFRYDNARFAAADVVTQPYDKITAAMQARYYDASPYNLVRIILGRRQPDDTASDNVYTRAAAHFRDWRASGVLQQDENPSFYVYSQRFPAPGSGEQCERRGFIALGRIEDYSAGIIHRHEQTLAKPKADRLELLRATRAHFEQIFMLYEDSGAIDSGLQAACPERPPIELTDDYGVLNRVWQVSDPAVVESVTKAMQDLKLVIADGHHRYETGLTYRDEQRATAAASQELPSDFLIMTLVNMNSPGLVILPTHRVVHSLPNFHVETFRSAAEKYFNVEEVDPAIDATRSAAILRQAGRVEPALLAVAGSRAFLIHKLKPAAGPLLSNLPLRQQFLDVSQLHKVVLENVLGLSEESIRNQQNISYIRDAAEAMDMARSPDNPANITFLMNPCRVSQVRDMSFAAEVMPQKSTDFYPKLLSGLTIYALA